MGLVMFAIASSSTAQDLPDIFDVTGVASTDSLNVRAEPSASTSILGSLVANAKGIEVTSQDPDKAWGRVNLSEGVGWVSMRFLERSALQPSLPATCFGTEPFWNLRLSRDDPAVFSTPENGGAAFQLISQSTGTHLPSRTAVELADAGQRLTAIIRPQECSDGMSDRLYGLAVDFVLSGGTQSTLYSGCCTYAAN